MHTYNIFDMVCRGFHIFSLWLSIQSRTVVIYSVPVSTSSYTSFYTYIKFLTVHNLSFAEPKRLQK